MNSVKLDTGEISGTIVGQPGQEIRIFRGIRYAATPISDLRWKRRSRLQKSIDIMLLLSVEY